MRVEKFVGKIAGKQLSIENFRSDSTTSTVVPDAATVANDKTGNARRGNKPNQKKSNPFTYSSIF